MYIKSKRLHNFKFYIEGKSAAFIFTAAKVPLHIPLKASLQFILTWCVEIRSVLKKVILFLFTLFNLIVAVLTKLELKHMCFVDNSAFNVLVKMT